MVFCWGREKSIWFPLFLGTPAMLLQRPQQRTEGHAPVFLGGTTVGDRYGKL